MKIIEGTVEEILEYQRRAGTLTQSAGDLGELGDDLPGGGNLARSVGQSPDEFEEDFYAVRQFVYARATSKLGCDLVLDYLERALELGTYITFGTSQATKDGTNNYLMIRTEGKQKFGAVAYVRPHQGEMTLRLRPEDVADIDVPYVQARKVVPTQQYAIVCKLEDAASVDVALDLTERALAKVRR